MPEGFFDVGMLANGGRIDRNTVPDGNNTITCIWVPNTITEVNTIVSTLKQLLRGLGTITR